MVPLALLTEERSTLNSDRGYGLPAYEELAPSGRPHDADLRCHKRDEILVHQKRNLPGGRVELPTKGL